MFLLKYMICMFFIFSFVVMCGYVFIKRCDYVFIKRCGKMWKDVVICGYM